MSQKIDFIVRTTKPMHNLAIVVTIIGTDVAANSTLEITEYTILL
jgi:hypothetical protein